MLYTYFVLKAQSLVMNNQVTKSEFQKKGYENVLHNA